MVTGSDVIIQICFLLGICACPVLGRVSAKYSYIPVCYRDSATWPGLYLFYHCNNPLYKTCYTSGTSHLCCGPDHHCCQGNTACCLEVPKEWNSYEKAGVALGITAWTGILSVFVIYLIPVVVRAIKRRMKTRKIAPKERTEMKEFKKKSKMVPMVPTVPEDEQPEPRKSIQEEEAENTNRRKSLFNARRESQAKREDTPKQQRRPPREPEAEKHPRRPSHKPDDAKPTKLQPHLENVQELEKKAAKEEKAKAKEERAKAKQAANPAEKKDDGAGPSGQLIPTIVEPPDNAPPDNTPPDNAPPAKSSEPAQGRPPPDVDLA